jgi:O-acetyl-ADP-ribose deacetylase (regulator of RNase III)
MIIIKQGNLLEAPEDILVHQVNIDGIMGGGVARQIAGKYPKTEQEYIKFCEEHDFEYENLKGKVDLTKENGKYIANMFSQDKYFNTNYKAMEIALEKIRGFAEQEGLTVALPYGIGCGIAKGDFNIVLGIINQVFKNYEVTIYKLEG